MSTQPPAEGPAPEEKKGLGKIVSRMRTILRRGDSTKARKRWSSASLLTSTKESAAPPTGTAPSTSAAAAGTAPLEPDTLPSPVITMRSGAELDRIRQLAEKYDIKLETKDWKVVEAGNRVEKPIRMRVHRTCHKCNASFGATRLCSSCGHRRCQACPRYPKKKDPTDKGKGVKSPGGRVALIGAEKEGDTSDGLKRKHKYVLKMPSRTGGQDLVMRKPKQRVRRNCHHCDTVYMPGNNICSKCSHVRCVNCPRDPPKRHKYPDGYPGDVFGSEDDLDDPNAATRTVRPRHIPRYFCHSCSTIFKPDSPAKCANCGHEKCGDCERVPPRKVKPELDPDILRRVEERLKELSLGKGKSTVDPPPSDQPAG